LRNCQGGGLETAAPPTDLMAQGAGRKRGVSKHLPALGDVSAWERPLRPLRVGGWEVAELQKREATPLKTNGCEQNCIVPGKRPEALSAPSEVRHAAPG
jgi:hypothetical protein